MGDELMPDFDNLTDQELVELIDAAKAELARRQSVDALNDQIGALLQTARAGGAAETPEQGAAWVQPTGAHDAYLAGDVVTHDGKVWNSTVNYNTWAPGVSGWRLQDAEDGTPAEWVKPSGTHDGYAKGDRVTFEGSVYESIHDGVNTWSPTEYPAAWQKVD